MTASKPMTLRERARAEELLARLADLGGQVDLPGTLAALRAHVAGVAPNAVRAVEVSVRRATR